MKAILAGLVGLLCCIFGPAYAQDGGAFKLLRLEGHQVRWLLPRDMGSLVVTYQLATGPIEFAGARNCGKMTKLDELMAESQIDPGVLRAELTAAFGMWEASANITFQEAREGARVDIVIGAQVEPEGWAFADVFYDTGSASAIRSISKALVCLNPMRRWKVGFDGDLKRYDLRYTFAHEIGHAIGLDHPNGGDQIMGYRYEERFRALQPGDIGGAIALYGAARQADIGQQEQSRAADAQVRPFVLHPFAKRWGTRGFNAPPQ